MIVLIECANPKWAKPDRCPRSWSGCHPHAECWLWGQIGSISPPHGCLSSRLSISQSWGDGSGRCRSRLGEGKVWDAGHERRSGSPASGFAEGGCWHTDWPLDPYHGLHHAGGRGGSTGNSGGEARMYIWGHASTSTVGALCVLRGLGVQDWFDPYQCWNQAYALEYS